MEKLQQYVTPIRQKVSSLQSQISQSQQVGEQYIDRFPQMKDIESFAIRTACTMRELNFETKRKIVLRVVDEVTANKEKIIVKGCIPIVENVALCTTDRNSQDTIRLNESGNNKGIPFEFTLELPIRKNGIDYGFKKGKINYPKTR